MANKLLMDGSKMDEKAFYEKLDEYLKMPYSEWYYKDTTIRCAGSEWYQYEDDNYVLCGGAYNAPCFYEKCE